MERRTFCLPQRMYHAVLDQQIRLDVVDVSIDRYAIHYRSCDHGTLYYYITYLKLLFNDGDWGDVWLQPHISLLSWTQKPFQVHAADATCGLKGFDWVQTESVGVHVKRFNWERDRNRDRELVSLSFMITYRFHCIATVCKSHLNKCIFSMKHAS